MTQDFSQHDPSPGSVDGVDLQQINALNTIGTISYVLHLIVAVSALIPGGQFGPILLIAALLIDLVKRDDARGTWHASHFRWRIRTVIIAGVLYLVTFPLYLLLYFPGAIAWLVISIWFLYRIVTGMVRMNKGRPMEFST
ncbi:MAG TPA: hypothetical protein PLB25_02440 [Rhodoferax sp.]|nr:hypothetical protein [Rhodoferax sp.]